METVASFTIGFSRILDAGGTLVAMLPEFAREPASLVRLYSAMVLARTFDAKAIALQRTGRLGTYASSLGQEAVAVGIADAMAPEDVLLPSFRDHGAQLVRGVEPRELFLFWGGDERGSDFAGPREDFPVCIPVGSQAPHAAGIALAFKLRREPRVAVCCLGDGATSKGDVYEAWNMAGLWRLPAVFVVSNNQWAISVPRAGQTAAETLAQKAIAAGIPGRQVDGNDVIAVCDAVGRALDRARAGDGPSVIEALTYRLSDHTTADDASHYRDDDAVSARWPEEPISRLRAYFVAEGAWGKAEEEELLAGCGARIEAAATAYLETPPQSPATVFDYLYAELPETLQWERRAFLEDVESHG